MTDKPDLFSMLASIDSQDRAAFDDIEKDFSPFMMMKWMASCKDPTRILMVNELLNISVFALHKEKRLLYYLCCAIADGDKKRYNWVPRYKNQNKVKSDIIAEYFSITEKEAKACLWKYKKEDYVEMLLEMGYTEKEIKALSKKLNDS